MIKGGISALINGQAAALWLSVAALAATVICVLIIIFDIKKRNANTKRHLLIVSACILGLIWLWNTALDAYEKRFSFVAVISNFVSAVKTFGFNVAFEDFAPPVSRMASDIFNLKAVQAFFFKAYITVIYFMAPAAGAAIVLEFIVNIFAKVKLKLNSLFPSKEIYYFNTLNRKALELAKSICASDKKGKVIVFADVYTKKDEEESSELLSEAKCIGAICFKEDILHLPVRKRGIKIFVLIDDGGQKNIKALQELMEKDKNCESKRKILSGASVLVFCEDRYYTMVCDEIKHRANAQYKTNIPVIRTIDECSNAAKNMLKNLPLYEPLVGKEKATELQFTVIGSGRIGTEVLLSAYWYGQMLGVELNINVVSKEDEASFFERINYINSEILSTGEYVLRKDGIPEKTAELFCENGDEEYIKRTAEYKKLMMMYPAKKILAQPYFKIRYYQTDISNENLAHKLYKEHWQDGFSLKDTDYFVVALGSDAENIQLSEKLNKIISEYHLKLKKSGERFKNTVISCAVYDSATGRIINEGYKKDCIDKGTYIYAFATFDEVYNEKNIYMRTEEKRSRAIHEAYKNNSFTIDNHEKKAIRGASNKDCNVMQYNYWASIARSLHLRYKVFSAGCISESVFTCGSLEKREKLNAASLEKYYKAIKKSDGNESYDEKLVLSLEWLEHRRWNAFTRAMGFTTPDTLEEYADYTDGYDHKEMKLKMHLFLSESDVERKYDSLFDADISELDGLDSANRKLSKYCTLKAAELAERIDNLQKMAENCSVDEKQKINEQLEKLESDRKRLLKKAFTDYKAFDNPCEDFEGV